MVVIHAPAVPGQICGPLTGTGLSATPAGVSALPGPRQAVGVSIYYHICDSMYTPPDEAGWLPAEIPDIGDSGKPHGPEAGNPGRSGTAGVKK